MEYKKYMSREELVELIEAHVYVTDAWGGSKLAGWQYGHETMVAGIDDAVDAIIAAEQSHEPEQESGA